MNFELFIAGKIVGKRNRTFSRFIIRLAIVAVALSVAVMLIATSSVEGFRNQISEKMFGFWGHIHITNFDAGRSSEDTRISSDQPFYPDIEALDGIEHIQIYARKAGIVRTDEQMEGIILKGIGSDFDWERFGQFIKKGTHFTVSDTSVSNQILISQATADRLNLTLDDPVVIYFIQKPPRVRKFNVSGIYKTGLTEYDKRYALVDIGHIRKLNDWDPTDVGGFEIFIDNVDRIDELGDEVHRSLSDLSLVAWTIRELNPTIFDWLDLQKKNEWIILFLMVLVGGINMITALLVLIMERTNMIGILKALGAGNWAIQRIFIYHAVYIIGIGLLIGNVVGLGLVWLQDKFGIIELSEESYYVSVVPMDIDLMTVLSLNAGTLVVCTLMLLLPSLLVTRITPIKAIRWE